MVLFLLELLQGFKIPAAFSYTSTRMLLSFITALFFTLFLGPFFIRKLYELKIGQTIRNASECPLLYTLHEKKKETPTMGGILILFSMMVSLILWMNLKSSFTWILGITTLVLGFLGAMDDYLKLKHKNSKGIKAKKKMIVQTLFASCVAVYLLVPAISEGFLKPPVKEFETKEKAKILTTKEYISYLYIPFVKKPVLFLSGFLSFVLILLVIIGTSNAVNLTDGLDGLAAGCLVMVSSVLGLVAFLSSNSEIASYLNILFIEEGKEIAIYLFAMAGASLGFLWYNGYPAQVFMGDTGSLALGGILGVAAVLLRREFLLALVGGIFVVEALSVILQVLSFRYRNKKRIFLCTPLHHHFEFKGWPETKVVMRFWIIGLVLAIIGILSLKLQ